MSVQSISDDLDNARDEYMKALAVVWSYADSCAASPSMLNRGKLQAASRACQEKRVEFIAAEARLVSELERTRVPIQQITARAQGVAL